MSRRSILALSFGSILLTFGTGCDKLTRTRFDVLKVGVDDKLSVENMIGKPDHVLGETWRYSRHDKHVHVRLDFGKDGKIEGKSWADGKTGEWVGDGTLRDVEPEGERILEKKSRTTVNK